ncbi:hypothetical protein [Cysteiniphilum halobium]|uniref:hypothetical protein n=1 Tax=Cysteiniphilum halobium TaxID=2219059 RepID=UPI000E65DC89|nr:hypothetical protein [Cysteiniphilum halobium]
MLYNKNLIFENSSRHKDKLTSCKAAKRLQSVFVHVTLKEACIFLNVACASYVFVGVTTSETIGNVTKKLKPNSVNSYLLFSVTAGENEWLNIYGINYKYLLVTAGERRAEYL